MIALRQRPDELALLLLLQSVEVEQGKSSATGLADVTVATFQVRSLVGSPLGAILES